MNKENVTNSQHRIYDIIAHIFTGQITQEETEEFKAWLAESPQHQKLFNQFMKRTDMSQVYALHQQHRNGQDGSDGKHSASTISLTEKSPIGGGKWKKAAAVAAAVALLCGGVWWYDYNKVVAPKLDALTVAVIETAKQQGRTDAQVTIHSKGGNGHNMVLASAANVDDEKDLQKLYGDIGTSGDKALQADEMLADIVTYHDKEFWMTLPDGTRVHLNYSSSLTYPLQFTGGAREVSLEGEAYFFVAKDRRHPFIVHTKYGDVKQYGTEFNINTRYDSHASTGTYGIEGKGLAVVLVNGSVSVTPHGQAEHMLKPNDMAVVTSGSDHLQVKQIDTAPFTSWNTGSFAFEDCTLELLMDVVGRWYGKQYRFISDHARQIKFTGEIDRYETLENILSSLGKSTSTEIFLSGNIIVVGE